LSRLVNRWFLTALLIGPTPVLAEQVVRHRLRWERFAPRLQLRFNLYNAELVVARIRKAVARARDSRTDKPIVPLDSQTPRTIEEQLLLQDSQTVQAIVQVNQMRLKIAAQHLVPASRTTIVRVNRTRPKIAV
jgi:hypothetical protein